MSFNNLYKLHNDDTKAVSVYKLLEVLHRLCLAVGHAMDVFNNKKLVLMINFAAVVSDGNRYYQKARISKSYYRHY